MKAVQNNGIAPAILAAMLWGLSYTLCARLIHTYPPTVLMLVNTVATLPILLVLLTNQNNWKGIESLLSGKDIYLILAEMVISFCASMCILYAMKTSAVEASFIEISYPFFILMFSYLLFGDTAGFNFKTLLGGSLIFLGVLVITKH